MIKPCQVIKAYVTKELNDELIDALSEKGVSVADFIRAAAIHLIERREIPFNVDPRLGGHHDALAAKRAIDDGRNVMPRLGRPSKRSQFRAQEGLAAQP